MSEEKSFQKKVMDFLLMHPKVCVAWQNDSNRTRARYASAGKYKPKGLHDIIGMFKGGKFFSIELKIKPNKASDEQLDFYSKVNFSGGFSLIAWKFDEVYEWVNEISKTF